MQASAKETNQACKNEWFDPPNYPKENPNGVNGVKRRTKAKVLGWLKRQPSGHVFTAKEVGDACNLPPKAVGKIFALNKAHLYGIEIDDSVPKKRKFKKL